MIRYHEKKAKSRRMTTTLHLDASNPAHITQAADLLRSGQLVAFATETVYGLGANAFSAEAVSLIFAAKQRPSWDPLIVHLASAEQLSSVANVSRELAANVSRELAANVSPELAARVDALAQAFWPGPLTLLLPRAAAIPDAVTAGRELVGVRVPAHPAARALLAAAGLPIAAPSANLFGHTSPTTAAHVLADLDGRIDAVLDAGPTSIGLESTVLDPTQTPMVLYRPGAITAAQLTAVTAVPVTVFSPDPSNNGEHPKSLPSPGVGIRHYAPRARLLLVEGTPAALQTALRQAESNAPDESIGVLLPRGWPLHPRTIHQPWAQWDDPDALAAALFFGLRALDDRQVSLILCPLPQPGGLRDAIRDRLLKAAQTK
jgi:L-threonylcarbamoyladenylate synthase